MSKVVHFEIQATDPEALVAFYSEVFGWKVERWGPEAYWLVTAGPEEEVGINGAILPRPGPKPPTEMPTNAYVCTIQVESLDDAFAKALAHGGIEALPKMPVPGIGWVAYAIDPDGNTFGMLQPDPEAR